VPTTTQQASSETLTATLVALYVLAERQMLTGITQVLARTEPTLEGRQAALPRMRRLVRQVLGHLVAQSNPLAAQMITAAITEGRRDADRAVGTVRASLRLPGDTFAGAGGSGGSGGGTPGKALVPSGDDYFDLSMPHGERSANAIRADITSELQDVRYRITRLPDDIYKMIAPHGAIYQALENGVTPAQAQAMAWRVFVSQGITGFTDKSGRNWSLSAYVEMAVRTAATRAYNASHLARMHALDVHYFTVGDTGHPCPICFPWQHKVLTDGVIANPEIHVDATIAEATAAGLWHPNCKHALLPVIPGITVLPKPREWTQELADEYRLTQRQRHLELQVRKAKRELEYATDPKVRAEAYADVRNAQAKVRQFVNATGFSRQSRREQLNLSDHKIKMPTPIR
jgi:hypothetical protein